MAAAGFNVLGVEIVPWVAEEYKHEVILADVSYLDSSKFKDYDVIVGSPPCRDFSIIDRSFGHKWKRPPDPEGEGMRLVEVFLNFVKVAEPRFWLMENVPGLAKYIGPPKAHPTLGQGMTRYFWGEFPRFLIPRDMNKKLIQVKKKSNYPRKKALFERSRIPFPCAYSFAKACADLIQDDPSEYPEV